MLWGVKITKIVVLVRDERPELNISSHSEIVYATSEELPSALVGADALLIWAFQTIDISLACSHAKSLQWIHVASAGMDHIMLPNLVESDIKVTNGRGVLSDAIAEYVLACVLAFAKDLRGSFSHQQEHHWQHRSTERVSGQRALIIGPGSVGTAVGSLLSAVGMQVDGAGRTARAGDAVFGTVHANTNLVEVVGTYHYVIVAVPLTASTMGLINHEVLNRMLPDAKLINVGRGRVVDESALTTSILNSVIGGAALDVFAIEPLDAQSPLWDQSNVLISPHMAGDVYGFKSALLEVFEENYRRFTSGEPLINFVDTRSASIF